MNRGVAQPYFINLNNRTDIDINQIDDFNILFQQANTVIIRKFISNQDINDGVIKIMLTAQQTLKFYVGKCTIIIDGVLNDGTLFHTVLAYEDINDIYKDDADNLINNVTAADNGKVLGVQNGKAAFITPSGGGASSGAKNTVKYYYGDFSSENGNITSASYWMTPEMDEEDEVSWEYILNDYKNNGVLPIIMAPVGDDYSSPYIIRVNVPDNPAEEPSGIMLRYLVASTSTSGVGLILHTYFVIYDSNFELLTNTSSMTVHTTNVVWTIDDGGDDDGDDEGGK